MRTADDIVALFNERKKAMDPVWRTAHEIQRVLNNEIVLPTPETDDDDRSATPNLILQGVTQNAMRIASTLPGLYFPPIEDGRKNFAARAMERKRVVTGYWQHNRMNILLRRRARHMIAYSGTPIIVRPGTSRDPYPNWQIRHPLTALPAETDNPDDVTPDDCIFAYPRTIGWIKRNIPEAPSALARVGYDRDADLNTKLDILEYHDAEQVTLILLGKDNGQQFSYTDSRGKWTVLQQLPNPAGICWVVFPGRITSDSPQGQFDSVIGAYIQMAKLQSINYMASERGVLPETWFIARPNETPNVTQIPDPRRGVPGEVSGADIQIIQVNPGFQTAPTIDRLEEGIRGAGVPAEFSGMSPTNIRTGARGRAVLSAAIDFNNQEAQEILAVSLEEENKRAILIDKAFHNKEKTWFISWRGQKGNITYTPSTLFTDTNGRDLTIHNVTYSIAGADINTLFQTVAQMQGTGQISRTTAMRINPLVEDPEFERDMSILETLDDSLRDSLAQRSMAGMLPPIVLARLRKVMEEEHISLADAVTKVEEEMREEQATPTAPTDPAAQPGMAAPGEAPPSISPMDPSMSNLEQMLMQLRNTTGAPPNA